MNRMKVVHHGLIDKKIHFKIIGCHGNTYIISERFVRDNWFSATILHAVKLNNYCSKLQSFVGTTSFLMLNVVCNLNLSILQSCGQTQ